MKKYYGNFGDGYWVMGYLNSLSISALEERISQLTPAPTIENPDEILINEEFGLITLKKHNYSMGYRKINNSLVSNLSELINIINDSCDIVDIFKKIQPNIHQEDEINITVKKYKVFINYFLLEIEDVESNQVISFPRDSNRIKLHLIDPLKIIDDTMDFSICLSSQ